MPDKLDVYLHLGGVEKSVLADISDALTEFIKQVYTKIDLNIVPKLDTILANVEALVAAGPSGATQADIDAAVAKINELKARLQQSNTALDAKTEENK